MTENGHEGARAEGARRVVVGVDGSDNAAQAARWAAREALDLGLPLTVVHAVHLPSAPAAPYEPEDLVQRAVEQSRKLLESSAAELRAAFPGLTIKTVLSEQSAAHALTALAPETAVMVTGTRGRGGFTGMLVGSVSRKLAAHASCPLVVVRGAEAEPAANEVVFGVELGQSQTVIRHAFAVAQRYGAALRVVHAWWPAVYPSPMGAYVADVEDTREIEVKAVEELERPLDLVRPPRDDDREQLGIAVAAVVFDGIGLDAPARVQPILDDLGGLLGQVPVQAAAHMELGEDPFPARLHERADPLDGPFALLIDAEVSPLGPDGLGHLASGSVAALPSSSSVPRP